MSDHHIKRAKEILQSIQYATIATANTGGKPWNSPVAHVLDDKLNLYWFSDKNGVHSQNVRSNEDVFIVIYDSTVPYGQGEGVYIEAKAHEVNDENEIRAARRIKKGPGRDDPAEFMGDGIRRVYKAIPQRVWMNDDVSENGVFLYDIRVEISLQILQSYEPKTI